MTRTLLAMLATLLVAAQCDVKPAPPPPLPPPAPIPTPDQEEPPPDCDTACRRLHAMGCPEAELTDAGATCVEVCDNVQASGTIAYPVACVSGAHSCAEAEACFR